MDNKKELCNLFFIMNLVIDIKELTKYYNNLHVLDEISFRVDEGEFVSVIGHSGCGKTTLLKIISGLREPTKGQINVNNGPAKLALEKKQFGFVFQNPVLLPWRNVIKNIELPLEILGYKNPQKTSCFETGRIHPSINSARQNPRIRPGRYLKQRQVADSGQSGKSGNVCKVKTARHLG